MPRKRSKYKTRREPEIPAWQWEFLRTGELKWDPIFDEIENESLWPDDIHPDPWEIVYFSSHGAKDLWQRIRRDIDMSAFPYANKKYGMKNFQTI